MQATASSVGDRRGGCKVTAEVLPSAPTRTVPRPLHEFIVVLATDEHLQAAAAGVNDGRGADVARGDVAAGFTARYPHLRTLVDKTSARARLAPLRLWCHLMANRVGTFTGLAALVNRERREGQLVASFAWWPLAWLLTTGDVPIEEAADVSDWLQLRKAHQQSQHPLARPVARHHVSDRLPHP